MGLQGQARDINIHNADSTTGRKPAADVASVSLSNEDKAALDAINASIDVPISELVGGVYNSVPATLTDGQRTDLQLDVDGNLRVAVPADRVVTGTISALGASVTINCEGLSTVGWTTTGTWSGTISSEGSYNGTDWFLVETLDTDPALNIIVTSFTEGLNNDPWITSVAGIRFYRLRATAWTSGSAGIQFNGSSATGPTMVYQSKAGSLQATARLNDGAGVSITVGQKLMAASLPVTLASDQSALLVAQSGSWDVRHITGTVSLPTGAATAANQATANASLSSIDTKVSDVSTEATLALIKAKTDNIDVALSTRTKPSDQQHVIIDSSASIAVTGPLTDAQLRAVAVPVSAASLPLPTGASTAANQATANASLSSIDGKLGSLGQKTMALSAPVVISSDQTGLQPNTDLTTSGTIIALNGAVTHVTHGCGSAMVSIGGTWSATLQIQGLAPDGATWTNLAVAVAGAGVGTFSSSAITANGTYRCATAGGFSAIRVTATAFTSGTVNVAILTASTAATVGVIALNAANMQVTNTPVDGARATYSAAVVNQATGLLATDIFTITGSASKTIRVTKVEVSAFSGGNSNNTVVLLKRSTANTGGTSAAQTAVPHDSASAAATATVLAYTVNPTTGTLVGNLVTRRMSTPATNSASQSSETLFAAGRPAQAIVLRGVNEVLAVNLNGTTIAGDGFNIAIEWTEE